MPAFLLSPMFWKFAGAALLVLGVTIAIGAFVSHYKYITAQAALVPGLQSQVTGLKTQIVTIDSRANKAAIDLVAAYAARDQAVKDFGIWQGQKTGLLTSIQEMTRHAAASTNSVCMPSAAERQLWNDTIAKLTADPGPGQGGAIGQVPAGAGGVH